MKKPLNIGHRGAMGHETENTIASVKKALELNVDMIEIDVFLIKSGELVVFHDEILDSLTDTSGKIEEFTWEELQKVVVKGNHQIPTLDVVIETTDRLVALNIELKGKNTAEPTFQLLQKYFQRGWKKDDFVISSFLWDELEAFRKLDKQIPIAILTEENPLDAIAIGKKLKAVAINPWWKTLTKENVHQIHNEGFLIYTYTVNEPTDIKFVTELGVDGIFCNFPERLH
ncbi:MULTISPECIES: glycerophosphodiester phosphodiesterase family protein [unclassified Flavobacterium]|uniref:glycerophosphodiester phosphodiesterase n=1 Tax=unclassified Flavobacterium TaxID=196869 RepID=UPI0025B85C07|nr:MULTISPECIES: glycerophosphodiester phosphodiesterase family protein [unclassified Flavobacterium]